VRFQPLLTANWEQLQELERQEQERGDDQDEDGVKREKKGEEDEDNEDEGLGGRRRQSGYSAERCVLISGCCTTGFTCLSAEEEEDMDEDEENDYTTNFHDEGDDYGAADDEPDGMRRQVAHRFGYMELTDKMLVDLR